MSTILTTEIRDLAQQSVLCWLATVDDSGQPNVSPKEVWRITLGDEIVIANIASPTSARNIECQSKVCVSFIDVFAQKGFKVLGHATQWLPSTPGFAMWAEPLHTMVGERFPIRSVFVVRATEAHSILAPSYVFYASETTQESQCRAAMQTYGVQPKTSRP